MVVTKVFQIKQPGNLKNAINYIVNDAKTLKVDDMNDPENIYSYEVQGEEVFKRLVSGYDLTDSSDKETVYDDFILTKLSADSLNGNERLSDLKNPDRVLAHHLIQSFSPDDNLTPEQIHEIGRKTVLELTGGDHQFIIATHMDKGHIHNHIIFNTTNSTTLKKFEWKKGTKQSLSKISDKHSELAGAKIIEPKMNNSYTKYSAWKESNNFRKVIKDKLDFLLKNSVDLYDFNEKAKALNLEIDVSGKYTTFKLKDSSQKRGVRDRTLSKKGKYNIGQIEERLKTNVVVIPLEQISDRYKELQKTKEQDFEYKLLIEKWQIKERSQKSIYVEIEFGVDRKGTISIPSQKLDQLEDGNFYAYLKRNDFFYFLNDQNATQNKFVNGSTVIKQLAQKNGQSILTKNRNISMLNRYVEELNFLALNGVTNSTQFKELEDQFKNKLEETDRELERLDDKLAKTNKVLGALIDYQTNLTTSKASEEILQKARIDKNTDPELIKKEMKEIHIERTNLKNVRDNIVKDYDRQQNIKKDHTKQKNKGFSL
ncbi:relaxase/mobilization nuclease domain-containing protein [Streptococcus parasanguinis]|uniref:helical hairpin domain-containing protein n=1 Tax=Streptococcus parasanguinis TaxID=1318 RepID=UPI001913B550|nr:relaxase/mobilization nuclease domain-containing protein [Streptococcus parasanguinis]MBK5058435.1 relaxase/mobilization nuclease domain-containing protein [Streptococcus parasanguinis]